MWVFQPLPAAQQGISGVIVNVTGQSVTVSLGTVAFNFVTGQVLTTSVGTVSVVGAAITSVTGQAATVSVGTAGTNLPGGVTVQPTGNSITASVGTVQTSNIAGNRVTVSVGTVTASALPTNTVPPNIVLNSGYAGHYSGSVYTATVGTWTGGGSVVGNWQSNGANIPGATSLTHTLTYAQEGLPLRYQEVNTGVIANSNQLTRPALTPLLTDITSRPAPTTNPRPNYLTPYIDPTFGAKITRISDNPGTAIGSTGSTWGNDVHHQYNKFPVWNADETMMYIETNAEGSTGGNLLILHGQTYVPISDRTLPSGWREGRWDRLVPNRMVYTNNTAINYYNPTTAVTTVIRSFSGTYHSLSIGFFKGEQSNDNDVYPIRAIRDSDNLDVCFPYTISTNTVGPVIVPSVQFPAKTYVNGNFTISPLKTYMYVGFDDETAVIMALSSNTVLNTWSTPQQPTHHTGMVDGNNGFEYSVGAYSGTIIKRRYSDGSIVTVNTNSYAYHTCSANYLRGKWFHNDFFADSGVPYVDEHVIIAHNGSVAGRICHNQRGAVGDYENEPHGVISPTGKRIIFASTWRGAGSPSRPVGIYVADFRDRLLPGVEGDVVVTPTGNSITVTAGTPTHIGKANLSVTGQSSTVSVGTVSVTTSISVTGQQVTVSLGTVSTLGQIQATGQQVIASVGTTAVVAKAITSVTGNAMTASTSTVLVTPPTNTVFVTGQQLDMALGTATGVGAGLSVTVTGSSMTCDVGTVLARIDVDIAVTGNQLTATAASAGFAFGPSLMFARVGTVKVHAWQTITNPHVVWTPIED